MLPYWTLLAVLSIGSFLYRQRLAAAGPGVARAIEHRQWDPLLLAAFILIVLMIGLRYEVGGDWTPYQSTFRSVNALPLDIAFRRAPDEYAYTFVNWLVGRLGLGIWLVNMICAIPFVAGLAAISKQQDNPWLALVAAAPLFIIVVGMGYTRQAVAVGFVLIGIAGIIRGRTFVWFMGWALIASLFHTSALAAIPIMAVILFRGTFVWLLALIGALLVGYFVILPAALERYSLGYIANVYEAKGAIFRVVPNSLAGLALIAFPKSFVCSKNELRIWRGWAWLSIAALVMFFVIKSSVIVDRLSVYILPLQIFVLARLPRAFGTDGRPSLAVTVLVIIYSAVVLFLWLHFANHARYWIPYRLYPLD